MESPMWPALASPGGSWRPEGGRARCREGSQATWEGRRGARERLRGSNVCSDRPDCPQPANSPLFEALLLGWAQPTVPRTELVVCCI